MTNTEKNVQSAWDYVFNCLFHEKTNLIYDCRSTLEKDGAFSHLPTVKEVAAQIPSPCSWNAGLENSGINGGVMLNTVVNRYKATKDKSLHVYAEKLIKGIVLMTSVSGVRGFLARSVLPEDGKSYYFESSRDQYTHVIYGICRYLECELCTDEERAILSDILVAFAEYAEKCVTKENDYHLLRTDGGRTMVCKMLYCSPHEWTRLPMFYIAAWKVSGNEHWYDKYLEIRELCWTESYKIKKKYWERPFCLAQMQDSIRILYDYEKDEEWKKKYLDLMELVASFMDDTPVQIEKKARKEGRKFDSLCPVWRKQPMKFLCNWGAPVSGYGYYMPDRGEAFENDLWDLHDASNHVAIKQRCPSLKADPENVKALEGLFDLVDFERHGTESPCYMLESYWEVKANGK